VGWLLKYTPAIYEGEDTTHEISIFSYKLAVVSSLEAFPGKFAISHFRGVGNNRIMNLVYRKFFKKPFGVGVPALRFAELSAL